jgi:hypothetical protein
MDDAWAERVYAFARDAAPDSDYEPGASCAISSGETRAIDDNFQQAESLLLGPG